MNKLIDFIKQELTGWKAWEILWLFLACAIIMYIKWKKDVQTDKEAKGD